MVCWALTPLLGLPAFAQSVISAHSGLIHFTDGSVFLDDERVEQKAGKFPQMNNGSELRTQDGRAEVLLTPGTFLRMGSNSAVRMVSNQLDDTRVELLSGSAVLDEGSDTLANTSVTILYNLDQVHILKTGRYRFDSQPPQVRVEKGEAEVTADGKSVQATAGYVVPFEGKLTARRLLSEPGSTASLGDALDNWSADRDNTVAKNNTEAAAASDLSGVIDGWNNNPDAVLQSLGIPPYIPGMSSMIPPPGYGSSLYGSGLYGPGIYTSSLYPGIYGSALYPFSLYGPGPLLMYGMPLYRPYGSYAPSYVYRGLSTYPGRYGYGYNPGRSVVTMRPGVGVGVGRTPVGVHVGGHR
jgi:hypothetical protein